MNKELKTIFLAVGLCLLFISCKEIHPKFEKKFPLEIIINPDDSRTDSIRLSEFAGKVEYIPLQTNDSILLDYVYNFKVTNDFIFVENGLDLLRFDIGGRFINKVYNTGRGQGETLPVCSAIDEEHERVFVSDRDKTIKVYSYTGDYLTEFKKPVNPVESLPPRKIEYFENHLFVSVPQRPGVKFIYSLFNLGTDSIIPLYRNEYSYTREQLSKWPSIILDDCYCHIFDTSLIFKEKFCDTVFILNRNLDVSPRFIINLGERKLKWETWRDNGMFNIGAGLPEGFWVHSVAESKSYLFLTLSSFKRPKIFALFDKESGKIELSTIADFDSRGNQVFLKNDLDFLADFPVFSKSEGHIFYSGECLYSVLEAKYFSETYGKATEESKNSSEYLRNMRPVFGSVNEFSNPVIMKVYLKQNTKAGLFEKMGNK